MFMLFGLFDFMNVFFVNVLMGFKNVGRFGVNMYCGGGRGGVCGYYFYVRG